MKNILKNRIFLVIITALICITGTAYAVGQIFASDIKYINKDNNETTVDRALDDLYDKVNILNNSNLNYDVLYQQDQTSSIDYSYTISQNDTQYKSIMVIVETTNISIAVSPANITIINENIVPIINPSEITYTEYGQYRITNDIYVGYINNIVKDDIIRIQGYYSVRMIILGIK